jgi:hypothetical protein
MVFEAELARVLLALKLIDKCWKGKNVLISLGNQVAIQALTNN